MVSPTASNWREWKRENELLLILVLSTVGFSIIVPQQWASPKWYYNSVGLIHLVPAQLKHESTLRRDRPAPGATRYRSRLSRDRIETLARILCRLRSFSLPPTTAILIRGHPRSINGEEAKHPLEAAALINGGVRWSVHRHGENVAWGPRHRESGSSESDVLRVLQEPQRHVGKVLNSSSFQCSCIRVRVHVLGFVLSSSQLGLGSEDWFHVFLCSVAVSSM
jgi:hypothetical protein